MSKTLAFLLGALSICAVWLSLDLYSRYGPFRPGDSVTLLDDGCEGAYNALILGPADNGKPDDYTVILLCEGGIGIGWVNETRMRRRR